MTRREAQKVLFNCVLNSVFSARYRVSELEKEAICTLFPDVITPPKYASQSRCDDTTEEELDPSTYTRPIEWRVGEWIERKIQAVRKFVNRYQWKKGRVPMERFTSESGKIETFVSIDRDGLLHVHSVMAYPDFDIPELGVDEIIGLAEMFHHDAEKVINARHGYWRKEVHDGRV